MLRFSIVPAGVIFFFIGLLWVSGCSRQDDIAAIRSVIEKGAQLAQDKQLSELMDLTAEGFLAGPGRHDRRQVKSILFSAFMYYGHFKIHFPQPTVELLDEGQTAAAKVYFLIVREKQTIPSIKELYKDPRRWLEAVGDKADLYQLALQFEKTGGDWRVRQAHLEGFKGTGF